MEKILCTALLGLACALAAPAQSYITKSHTGTTSAQVTFIARPGLQPRIVNLLGTSDKLGSVFSFRSGEAAYSVTVTNTALTNCYVNVTNGFAANDLVIYQKRDGTFTNLTVHSIAGYTNLNFTAAIGLTVDVGDSVYKLGSATTIRCGTNNPAAPTVYAGPSIYAGNVGRPLRVVLDGTSACSIDAATIKQE